MPAPTIAAPEPVPVTVAPGWEPIAVTLRGTAVLRCLELADLVRDLDAADRAYVAPYIADALVEAAVPDLPSAR
ncbi:MAG: hypothetical protein M3O34_03355 [Chloroflexota bacterium]|nr:hypothetical protein [Chloroflexota bacterium]